MKIYRLSWFEMCAAYNAGLSKRRIAELAGCTVSVVNYRLRNIGEYANSPAKIRAWVVLHRLTHHKGFRNVKGCYQVHNYIFHGQWGEICPTSVSCSHRRNGTAPLVDMIIDADQQILLAILQMPSITDMRFYNLGTMPELDTLASDDWIPDEVPRGLRL